jgi:FAD/FMN-containing dehydrogenase
VHGPVLVPGQQEYDTARRTWNGRIQSCPLLIVRCSGAADIRAAVRYARQTGLQLAVRSTGHNASGAAGSDGGLMIDLSGLTGVRVDATQRRACAQPGVRWGAFDHETQAFGLATTGGRISTTGVAGLTLGGGLGWLMRWCGLTVDNLLQADVVTADGDCLQASATDNADLFWALRGGGGNFGIVSSFTFRLHPVAAPVTGGAAFFAVSSAARVLRWFRDFAADAPDELSAQCNLLQAPPAPFIPDDLRGKTIVAIAVCHVGSIENAERDLACLKSLPTPLASRIQPMPYVRLQRLFDAAGAYGFHVHGHSGFLPSLSDELIESLVDQAFPVPSPQSIIMISTLGGAMGRVGDMDTAFGHRRASFNCAIEAIWTPPQESALYVAWSERLWSALLPLTDGAYVNELGDEGAARVRAAYHPAGWQRLRRIKRRYDPDNVFHLNQNIPPLPPAGEHANDPERSNAREDSASSRMPA